MFIVYTVPYLMDVWRVPSCYLSDSYLKNHPTLSYWMVQVDPMDL